MNLFSEKIREVLFSVAPITIIVILFNFTITPLGAPLLLRFLIGSILIILGLSLFLIGVDLGVAPLGSLTGSSLAKTNKLWLIIVGGFILGFVISIAEPGLIVLANQVDIVTAGLISGISIVMVVSVGLAIMLSFGFLRIVYNVPLSRVLTVLYGLTFLLALFASPEFLAISFDASGATTGVLAVPFILALAAGISSLKKDSKASENDSFGLIAVVSVGAIMSVLIMSIILRTDSFTGAFELITPQKSGIIGPFIHIMPVIIRETFLSLLPLLLILLVFQRLFELNRKTLAKIFKGFLYSFIGLFIFLVGVNAGFMDVGSIVGYSIAAFGNKALIIIFGFILGVVTILAEPAVYVLTHQIEDVTSGYVRRKSVLVALSVGVGFAVALSMIRILVPGIQLWHYLLPGYLISIALIYFTQELFVGIAFDAGGVATGPVTATFILAFTQGVAESIEGASVIIDGFGMIATVALTPIIALQVLGYFFKIKSRKEGLLRNEQ